MGSFEVFDTRDTVSMLLLLDGQVPPVLTGYFNAEMGWWNLPV